MKQSVILILAAIILLLPAAFARYEIGDTVNDFTLNDAYGNPVSLYDYEGKVVLINFWQPG